MPLGIATTNKTIVPAAINLFARMVFPREADNGDEYKLDGHMAQRIEPPRRFIAVSALIVAVFSPLSAGCLRAVDRPATTSAPDFPFSSEWTNKDASSSFLAVEFEVDTPTRYDLRFSVKATWNSSRALVMHDAFIQQTNGTAIYFSGQSVEGRTSCQMFPDAQLANECSPRKLFVPGVGSFEGEIESGRHLVLARAYGANISELKIHLASTQPVRERAVQEGRSSLILLDEASRTEGHPFNASIAWKSSNPFLGSFRVAGPREEDPRWEAQGPNHTHTFVREGPLHKNEWGSAAMEPTFPGVAGDWRLSAMGGQHSGKGPAYATLGILHDPFFVDRDGTMRQYGPF